MLMTMSPHFPDSPGTQSVILCMCSTSKVFHSSECEVDYWLLVGGGGILNAVFHQRLI